MFGPSHSDGVNKFTIGLMKLELQREVLFWNQQSAYKLFLNPWDYKGTQRDRNGQKLSIRKDRIRVGILLRQNMMEYLIGWLTKMIHWRENEESEEPKAQST